LKDLFCRIAEVGIKADQITRQGPAISVGVCTAINEEYFEAGMVESKNYVVYGNGGLKIRFKMFVHLLPKIISSGEYIVKNTIINRAPIRFGFCGWF
jgi:hypothetical protein